MSQSLAAADRPLFGAEPARRAVTRVLLFLVIVDVLLVAWNALVPPSFLNLDEEQNFPTWYSSAKLFATAFAALWCMRLEPAGERRGLRGLVWPAVAALFTALSMDETATAHERLAAALMKGGAGASLRVRFLGGDANKDSFMWPILLAPVVIGIVYFLVNVLWTRMRHDRRSLVFGLCGCVAFAAAIVLEVPAVYDSGPLAMWSDAEMLRYRFYSFFEESAEVLGATLMLAALLLHAGRMEQAAESAARS